MKASALVERLPMEASRELDTVGGGSGGVKRLVS